MHHSRSLLPLRSLGLHDEHLIPWQLTVVRRMLAVHVVVEATAMGKGFLRKL